MQCGCRRREGLVGICILILDLDLQAQCWPILPETLITINRLVGRLSLYM